MRREFRIRKSGRCGQCGEKYRVRGDVNDHCSNNYKQWTDHNREVQKTGMGAEVCWHCFRYCKDTKQACHDKPNNPEKKKMDAFPFH